MAEIKQVLGTTTTLTVSGLATLANNSSATSAAIDNTTELFLDMLLEVSVTTGAAAVVTGLVEIYVKGSLDGTDYDDDANDKWLGTVSLTAAGAGVRKRVMTIAPAFGGSMPAYLQIRFKNTTGAALTAATVQYRGIKAQTV